MNNFSLTVNHFYGDSNKYINKILEGDSNFENDKQLTEFTKSFLKHYPITKINDTEAEYFRYHISQAYKFFTSRKEKKSQIDSYSTDFTEQGNGSTVIQILGDDVPFLLDSTLALIKKRDLKLFKVVHPIINCLRSDTGNLLEIDSNDSTLNKESLIHLQIQKINDVDYLKDLINEIKSVIESVYLCVEDWQKIIKAVHNYTEYFEHASLGDPNNLERKEFLAKLESEYYVFLGAVKYDINPNTQQITLDNKSLLGIMKRDTEDFSKRILENLVPEMLFDKKKKNFIEIGKINKNSQVHRDTKIDYVCIKHFDEKLDLIGVHVFVGLFTSILYFQSSKLIPLIRMKVNYVLEKGEFSKNSYDGKEIISIIENLPRDELFNIKKQELANIIHEISTLLEKPALRLFIKESPSKTSMTILLFIPDVRFSSELSEKLETKLADLLGEVRTLSYKRINESKMGFYHIIIDKSSNCPESDKRFFSQLEVELEELTSTWRNKLKLGLLDRLEITKGYAVYDIFKKAFPPSYKVDFIEQDLIYQDISQIMELLRGSTCFRINQFENGENNKIYLKVYSETEYNLSDLISIIQNMGFKVSYEVVYEVKPAERDSVFIHSFVVQLQDKGNTEIDEYKERLEDALSAVKNKIVPDDILNQLVISAKLTHRQVMLIRAIVKYLCQISIGYSKDFIYEVLIKHPEILTLMLDLFSNMFDPEKASRSETNHETCKKLISKINKGLVLVTDSIEDKIIRACFDVILNMVRTNYFVLDENGHNKDYLSFKINSENMPGLPYPIPFREIFVYSTFFEAIHLRSSKVSRGGIRWSDRSEDFRTEILGLMKAQVAKNSVIVPTGSKGGFVIAKSQKISKDEYYQLVVECYKNFLRGMLDITDNIVNGKTTYPNNVVRRDDDDPYLVVAADKGTAKFSDFANSVSKEYNYWLGDAFASGGSAGYDHKQMGITAKGAWASVDRHFTALGINSQKDNFTVAGIGDMSGDVFGNGLLLSEHIKLLAAFNHIHIFIDPHPDPKRSFQERKRLFNLPSSNWTDYDQTLISTGGAVFNRSAKTIELTKEMKELFGLNSNEITPNELVSLILKMNVDLFWNGGIGTYIKATNENNIDVGDKSNDEIRINGCDLKCKVFAEGGNLGLTQLGRIEYALGGGHINTDAIDNSAGVDCSDHEVNIKIAFNKALESNKLSIPDRDKLLEKMTNNVAKLVLEDNYKQNLILTVAQQQSQVNLSNYDRLIKVLESKKIINRKLEQLPSSTEFTLRLSNKKGLTKPELSTLLAFTKNHICSEILKTNLTEDPYFIDDLINYFPDAMHNEFINEIKSHPLKREIIATGLSNNMLNKLSCFYTHLTSEDMGINFASIAKAYIITRDLFDMEKIWTEISHLDGKISIKMQVELFIQALRFVSRSATWILRNIDLSTHPIIYYIDYFKPGVDEIKVDIKKILKGTAKHEYLSQNQYYTENNVSSELSCKIALLNAFSSVYNIIYVSKEMNQPTLEIAELFFKIGQILNYEWLKSSLDRIDSINDWQRLSVRVYKDELLDLHKTLVLDIIANFGIDHTSLENWLESKQDQVHRYNNLIEEMKKQEVFENSMVPLLLQRLYGLLKK